MKRLMLVLFSFISVVVFLYLGNNIYENKYKKTVDSNNIEYRGKLK